MGKRDLSSEQLPQTQGIAEHVGLDSIACTLGEYLWGHPAQVLYTNTKVKLATQNTLATMDKCFLNEGFTPGSTRTRTHTH